MSNLTWTNAALVAAAVYGIVMIARWHLDRTNRFDARDYFLDQNTNRASLYNLITIVMAVLAVWVVVKWTLAGKDVVDLVLGVLGIFVVGKEVRRGIDAYDRRSNTNDDQRIERKGDSDDVSDAGRDRGFHGPGGRGEVRAQPGRDGDGRGRGEN